MLDFNLVFNIFMFWMQIFQPELQLIDEPELQNNALIVYMFSIWNLS